MNGPTSFVIGIAVVVAGLYAMVLSQLFLAFALWGLAGYLLISAGSGAASSGDRTGEDRVDDEPEPTAECARCGQPVAARRDRCDDCGVVGSWRK